jgi:hypothetical protein
VHMPDCSQVEIRAKRRVQWSAVVI